MSFFGVTLEQIGTVSPIEGADRIEVATLRGGDFQFVIAKGSFAPGDPCLYFPVDSLVPEPVAQALGVAGKLAGAAKNRVKTIRLRGQISQGVVAKTSIVPDDILARGPEAITAHLGVTKYEVPEEHVQWATLLELPDGISVYDIEGADRYTEVAAQLLDTEVVVTEKLEGSNFSVAIRPDGQLLVNQRTKTIVPVPDGEHTFWRVARESRIVAFAHALAAKNPGKQVLVYGELFGPAIQGNYYKRPRHEVRLFDIRFGHDWLAPAAFGAAVAEFFGDATRIAVPVLFEGRLSEWLAGRSIKDASNGRSVIADVAREGLVIRPLVEQAVRDFGRLILKQRSPEYLAKTEH